MNVLSTAQSPLQKHKGVVKTPRNMAKTCLQLNRVWKVDFGELLVMFAFFVCFLQLLHGKPISSDMLKTGFDTSGKNDREYREQEQQQQQQLTGGVSVALVASPVSAALQYWVQ